MFVVCLCFHCVQEFSFLKKACEPIQLNCFRIYVVKFSFVFISRPRNHQRTITTWKLNLWSHTFLQIQSNFKSTNSIQIQSNHTSTNSIQFQSNPIIQSKFNPITSDTNSIQIQSNHKSTNSIQFQQIESTTTSKLNLQQIESTTNLQFQSGHVALLWIMDYECDYDWLLGAIMNYECDYDWFPAGAWRFHPFRRLHPYPHRSSRR